MSTLRLLALSFPLVSAILLGGCGGEEGGEVTANLEGPFIALGRDFDAHESWESLSWEAAEAGVHSPGPRTVYINARPPAGSTEFPVGTIIVKAIAQSTEGGEQVLAMVKRGGDFNLEGARNWEWFELSRTPGSGSVILWRGLGPPAGHRYGDSDDTCNSCHAGAADNDFVLSPHLRLADSR